MRPGSLTNTTPLALSRSASPAQSVVVREMTGRPCSQLLSILASRLVLPREGEATRADLPIYFAVAAGVQAFADRQFDQSVRFLCEARTRIKDKQELEELRIFSDMLASKAVAELRKRPNSVYSMLPDSGEKSTCEFVTTR